MHIATLANLASGLAVIVAVIFGSLQVQHMARTRALFTAAELVRAMLTREFSLSVRKVLTLPDHADPELIRQNEEMADAVLSLSHVFESLGVLVFHRVIPLHLVDDLMGGYIRQCWRKIRPYVEVRRKELGISYGEWLQWLAERIEQFPSPGKQEGAHFSHRDWKP